MTPEEFFGEGGPAEELGKQLPPGNLEVLCRLLNSEKKQHILCGSWGSGKTLVLLCGMAYDIWEFFEKGDEVHKDQWRCVLVGLFNRTNFVIEEETRSILAQVDGWKVEAALGEYGEEGTVVKKGEESVFVHQALTPGVGTNLISIAVDTQMAHRGEWMTRWLSRGPVGRCWKVLYQQEDETLTTLRRPDDTGRA